MTVFIFFLLYVDNYFVKQISRDFFSFPFFFVSENIRLQHKHSMERLKTHIFPPEIKNTKKLCFTLNYNPCDRRKNFCAIYIYFSKKQKNIKKYEQINFCSPRTTQFLLSKHKKRMCFFNFFTKLHTICNKKGKLKRMLFLSYLDNCVEMRI